jgi:hypothetical protein
MAVVSDYWKNRYKSKPFFFYNTHFDFLKKQISFQRSHSRRTCHGLSFPFVVRRGENVLRSLWTILVTLTTNERDRGMLPEIKVFAASFRFDLVKVLFVLLLCHPCDDCRECLRFSHQHEKKARNRSVSWLMEGTETTSD